MLKKAVSKAAGESKPEEVPTALRGAVRPYKWILANGKAPPARPTSENLNRYVEDFDEPRTPLAGFFSILLEEAALLEILFVNDRGGFGRNLSPFLQQTFDVFPNQVRFQIDLIADLLKAQGRDLRRMWNNRDSEPTIRHVIDRQADAVSSDGPFQNTVSQNIRRGFNRQQDGVPILLAATNCADTVYVTGHKMPTEPLVEPHCPFEIQR